MIEDRHGDDLVAGGQQDAAHAGRCAGGAAPAEDADILHREADALALRGRQQHVILLGRQRHIDNRLRLVVEFHDPLAERGARHAIGKLVAADAARGGREHDILRLPQSLIIRQRQDGGDALAGIERQHVDERLAARAGRRLRQTPDLHLVDLPQGGEEKHHRVRVRDEKARHEILVLRAHARAALAAAPLRPVHRQRHALDITGVADGDDHVLAGDEILILHVGVGIGDLGLARGGEGLAHDGEFIADDVLHAQAGTQDIEEILDLIGDLLQLLADLVAAERG